MTLSHDLAGEGPSAVVLLHSGVCDRRMWDAQFAALAAAGHRVLRCDLRGFGETPVDAPHTHSDDVVALLDTLEIDRAAVVGSSFGGAVALEIAARHPERVSALALLCPAVPDFEPSAELRAWGGREDALLEAGDIDGAVALNVDTWLGPEAGAEARERVRVMQRRAFEVQLAAPEEFRPLDPGVGAAELAAIELPALVVSGAHDVPDFREMATRLAALLPDAQYVRLDWAGHLPALERPEETGKLLVEYLAAGPGAPRAAV
ncbi:MULTISPECIES: alpha/beta fold hydrolase [Streptomyces]|uniref:alpha/beta fold hydrolase n=1 Tax=Streptomyces TaxID=1883 RepID=UPI0013165E92|nr:MULTISPECIES: alpha/beta hydrolase [Streptomyces]QGZ50578.1 alpha/beta fold hydrolase [Streptomyces sp. QHH-9511]GGT89775.1 alpha/beta hydrolase [Streptomyces lateritius]